MPEWNAFYSEASEVRGRIYNSKYGYFLLLFISRQNIFTFYYYTLIYLTFLYFSPPKCW